MTGLLISLATFLTIALVGHLEIRRLEKRERAAEKRQSPQLDLPNV